MSPIVVRAAGPEDVGTLMGFVRALATFERVPDAVHASEADLLRDGFGANPRFEARLALIDGAACHAVNQPAATALSA